ncbi:hypothetical protein Saso_45400 [Streptomyces asoensis]|uniref:Uncharacterized protein n=1 Tax=Streptomyces asoensis TaxID=249586 RepID=A0ABQ3S440_9ACTN|nr:hypothetical protein GCM10010496_50530 [Streptomyces asoensis]GHI62890.1 hypothetical protein Saso_45400 [Streptomyces asoensis]
MQTDEEMDEYVHEPDANQRPGSPPTPALPRPSTEPVTAPVTAPVTRPSPPGGRARIYAPHSTRALRRFPEPAVRSARRVNPTDRIGISAHMRSRPGPLVSLPYFALPNRHSRA